MLVIVRMAVVTDWVSKRPRPLRSQKVTVRFAVRMAVDAMSVQMLDGGARRAHRVIPPRALTESKNTSLLRARST
jgi:hypothetical protein